MKLLSVILWESWKLFPRTTGAITRVLFGFFGLRLYAAIEETARKDLLKRIAFLNLEAATNFAGSMADNLGFPNPKDYDKTGKPNAKA